MLATRFVADGARRVGAHVVYVSTDYVFDGTKVGAYIEWDTPSPQSVYGRTKLGGELEIDPAGRSPARRGCADSTASNMVKTLLRLAEGGGDAQLRRRPDRPPHVRRRTSPRWSRSSAIERVPGVFHVTNQGAVSWYEFAREVFAAAGHDPERVRPISTAELQPPRPAPRPANSVLDNVGLRAHGFEVSRDFREPLAELVAVLQA